MDQPRTHRLSGYGVSESVVCIEGRKRGAGVAISPRHIATCAHVVLDALGLPHEQTSVPQGSLQVSVREGRRERHPKLHILSQWCPVDAGDIALLELDTDEPDLLPACSRVLRGDQWPRQTVDVFGYPQEFDEGQWARLSCHNAIDDGSIQCSPQREGFSGGYSGGPAFDETGKLLGLARAMHHLDEQRKYDYIIPIGQVLELLPEPDAPRRQPYFDLARVFRRKCDLYGVGLSG